MTDDTEVSVPGWVTAKIVEVLAGNSNGKPFQQGFSPQCDPTTASTNEWGVLKTTAIQENEFWEDQNKRLPASIPVREHLEVAEGDILMTCAGPRSRCGVACYVRRTRPKLLLSGKMYRFRTTPEAMEPKFLMHFLATGKAQAAIDRMKTGINDSGLNLTHSRFANLDIPVAPLPEQRRIVEKIEMLFAQLDKGEEAVRQVQALLKRYRQSVLKAAVTGALTADWRAENRDKLEHGRDLLSHILDTRRANWSGRGRYDEPVTPDTADLPELPEGWVWASFEQLFAVFGGATPSRRKPEFWGGDIPWVSSGEVAFCRIGETKESITEAGLAGCSTKLHPVGTVLLAMIGEGKTRGQAAILDVPACNNQNAAAIRVSESGIPPEYVYYFLLGNYEESRRLGQGGNQPALNGAKVKALMLPLPSAKEINEIVERIEKAHQAADVVAKMCEVELARSAALRQSILKQAFSGRLVSQDPADEPASALFERIRAAAPVKKTRKAKA